MVEENFFTSARRPVGVCPGAPGPSPHSHTWQSGAVGAIQHDVMDQLITRQGDHVGYLETSAAAPMVQVTTALV